MINCRRKAREAALQALYQCDALGDWSAACVDLYFSEFQKEATENPDTPNENLDFARTLIGGVMEKMDFIDAQISASSTHWSIARMSRVDRNIIRVASYEIAFVADIPSSVTINEAIEIAKKYSSDDSPMFINGVLDNISAAFAQNPSVEHKALSRERRKKVVNQ